MAKNSQLHRVYAYIRHWLSAWNTTGEGIHSPYLFHLVRFILRDRNEFYSFEKIERQRMQLLLCTDSIDVVDYGSRGSKEGTHIQRRINDIARNHLESTRVGQVLFRLINVMGQNEKRPLEILELGTSLGITTAYLASPSGRNHITTLEGSEAVLKIAQGIWRTLKIVNIEWHQGNIDDTLYLYARDRLDVAYVDANHTYEATRRYVEYLLPRMTEKGVIILDDIHYSKPMEQAWEELKTDKRVTTSMDLYHVGLLFVDPHYLKRHYTIKI